jgi:hypothetical protein
VSIFDRFRRTAEKAVKEHGDALQQGVDKAAEAVDRRTKGKYSGRAPPR